MVNSRHSYSNIFKATSILGGVQVVTIIFSIIKSKASAVWLGPEGVGIFTLFTSAIALIVQLCNMGLSTSAVKSIAISYHSADKNKLSLTISVFKKLVWITGLAGFILTLLLSYFLSHLNFKNDTYVVSFMLLGFAILFNQLTAGETIILQGMQKTRLMAKGTLYGGFLGLLASLVCFYFLRLDGIIPSIIIAYIVSYIVNFLIVSNLKIPKVKIDLHKLKTESSEMLRIGFMVSIAGIATQFYTYAVRILVGRWGSIEDVGFYSAAASIITTYFGMVFTAMGTDYFPRLSKLAANTKDAIMEMNKQAEIALLIISPLLITFISFMDIGVKLLYSKEFLPIIPILQWSVMGVFFQAFSWSLAFIFLAKGDSKIYLLNEIFTILYFLLLHILGYYFLGLPGLGMAFLTGYVIYALYILFMTKKRYGFYLTLELKKIMTVDFLLIFITFLINLFVKTKSILYIINILLIVGAGLFTIAELNKKTGLLNYVKSKVKSR